MMKKSQILAAIALAMALGVVAPVVNVNAAQQGDSTLTINSQKAAKTALEDFKKSFDTIKALDADGDVKSVYEGAAAYGLVADVYGTVNSAANFVKDAEKANAAVTNAFRSKVAGYVTDASTSDIYASVKAIDDVMDLFRSADDWDDADLATAKATTVKVIGLINNAASAETNSTTKTELQMVSHNLQEVITDAEIQKLVDVAVANGSFTNLTKVYNDLTGKTAGTITTEAKLNTIISGIKGVLGSNNWGKYSRATKVVTKIEEGLKNHSASDVQLDAWVAQLKGAANGTGETPVVPAEPSKDGAAAPNTGIAGTAEGTATTVSIVAGLATALTALGAGVVAYRSARRK